MQYRVTQNAIKRFEEALCRADDQGPDLHPLLQQAMREGIESELEILRAQVAEYEAQIPRTTASGSLEG